MADTDTPIHELPAVRIGWLGVIVGLFAWFLPFALPPIRLGAEAIGLYYAAIVGSVAAVAVGLGLWATRFDRPRWVGFVAVTVGGTLVVRSAIQIASRL